MKLHGLKQEFKNCNLRGDIMKKKRVVKFYADDNTEFDTAAQCQQYENELKFKEWYETESIDNELWANNGQAKVDTFQLIQWLQDNREQVLSLLK